MKLKKVFAIVLALSLMMSLMTACGRKDESEVNVGVIKGPTGVGAVNIVESAENGTYPNYHFTLTGDANDMVAKLTNGELDIGALPTNTAVNLYNKTNGAVRMIAINCTSVLYILENGNTVNSIKDLKGKTIYVNGQGANPEYVLNYVLRKNGLEPGVDVDIQFKDATEISTLMVSGDANLCMLPVPAATAVMKKNADVRKALEMATEYDAVTTDGSHITMGCLVATEKFINEHPDEVNLFIERYEDAINEVHNNIDAAAELVAKYEITGNAAIAKAAIPDCGIVCITGKDMKTAIEGYYNVLFEANPASIGGSLPADDFYYEK